MAVVGSSLGGYYASYVAQRKGCKSVLLNPAVAPDETLAQYIDSHQPLWHQPANAQEEAIFFRAEYIDELRALSVRALPPGGPELGIFCTGDEVLDWREMVQRYPQAQQRIVQGGDHAISDFATLVPEVLSFFGTALSLQNDKKKNGGSTRPPWDNPPPCTHCLKMPENFSPAASFPRPMPPPNRVGLGQTGQGQSRQHPSEV